MTRPRTASVDLKDTKLTVPQAHWTDLCARDLEALCHRAEAEFCPPDKILIDHLNSRLRIDVREREILRRNGNRWDKPHGSLMELLTLVYLLGAASDPLSGQMIGIGELKDAHFFQGPHALNMAHLLEKYGNDRSSFQRAAESLGGVPLNLADAAYRLFPFPKTPVCFLLWEGDAEFGPNLSVLFDRSIERHLSADAIWGVVNLVSQALSRAPEP